MSNDLMSNDSSTNKRSVRSASDSINGWVLGALLAIGLGHTQAAYAHGTVVETTQAAVAVKATFDDGKPMADAQVLIYSPSDPETPWRQGQTDDDGTFLFEPDAEIPGTWEVTVRKAGHGATTTFLTGKSGQSEAIGISSVSPFQKWLSVAAVVWGFVGTALFFSRKPVSGQPVSNQSDLDQPSSSQSIPNAAAKKMPIGNTAGGPH